MNSFNILVALLVLFLPDAGENVCIRFCGYSPPSYTFLLTIRNSISILFSANPNCSAKNFLYNINWKCFSSSFLAYEFHPLVLVLISIIWNVSVGSWYNTTSKKPLYITFLYALLGIIDMGISQPTKNHPFLLKYLPLCFLKYLKIWTPSSKNSLISSEELKCWFLFFLYWVRYSSLNFSSNNSSIFSLSADAPLFSYIISK